jgi:pimeloyl-ACP methyl ester carboxylesterase
VVVVDPLGYDALSLRRPMRILADRLAGQGVPVLRYDQPGAGDSADDARAVTGMARLSETLHAACLDLMAETGVQRVVLVGSGLGALLSVRWAAENPIEAAGLALLAPVVSGRSALREWQMRAAMIGDMTGSPPAPVEGAALSVAGLHVSDALAAEIRGLKLDAAEVRRDLPVLALARPGVAGEEAFAETFAGRSDCESGLFEDFDAAVCDPTLSLPPEATFDRVEALVHRVLSRETMRGVRLAPALSVPVEPILKGDGWREQLVVFGPEEALVGVWCAPERQVSQPPRPVVFLGAGGNPRAGWARGTTEMARRLASETGTPSLRFDLADVGDSRRRAGAPAMVHYWSGQTEELAAALDLCDHFVPGGKAVVMGACGGAYLALNGAMADERVSHVIAINLQRFLWDNRDDVDRILRLGNVATRDYGGKLLDAGRLRRLLCGQVAARAILAEIARRAVRKVEQASASWLFGLSPFSRLYRRVHRGLAELAARRVPLDLFFSQGDPGLSQLDLFFGRSRKRLSAYENIEVRIISGADHNLTRAVDREPVFERLRQVAGTRSGARVEPKAARQVATSSRRRTGLRKSPLATR